MNSRKVIYGVLIIIGIGAAAGVRYARYNDVDLPWWTFLLGLPLIVALIAMDVRHRRTATSRNASVGEPDGSGANR